MHRARSAAARREDLGRNHRDHSSHWPQDAALAVVENRPWVRCALRTEPTREKELSPPSKHYLFLGGVAQLSETALRKLCDPDYAHNMAYIALGLDRGTGEAREQVGVCRYAGADSVKGAEISVAVADAWQHQGLGKMLLGHLIDYARAHGVRRLYSLDAIDNQRMRKLARDVGFSEYPDRDDLQQVIYSLDLLSTPGRS